MKRISAVILTLFMAGCSYVPPRIHLNPGPSIVYQDNGDTMVVSEGYVQAAYQRWRKTVSRDEAQMRLNMLCVETKMSGEWVIRKSDLWR